MSELDAIKIILNNHGKPMASIQGTTCYYGIAPNDMFYSKGEADKVIEEKNKEIEELKEERRWRKFSKEKPENNGIYIVLLGEHTRTLDVYDTDKGKFRTYMPTAWMPLPSAPKEDK